MKLNDVPANSAHSRVVNTQKANRLPDLFTEVVVFEFPRAAVPDGFIERLLDEL